MFDTQPQPIPPMTVAGNRNAKNVPVGPDGRDWSHGLCNRSGFWGTWCVSYWCPCITYGRVKHRYEHMNTQGTPDPEHGGCLNFDCLIHGVISRLTLSRSSCFADASGSDTISKEDFSPMSALHTVALLANSLKNRVSLNSRKARIAGSERTALVCME